MTTGIELPAAPWLGYDAERGDLHGFSHDEVRSILAHVIAAVDAHELWAAAQLVPGEGIEDGVSRIEDILHVYAQPEPDKYCYTQENGECISTDPRCMHNKFVAVDGAMRKVAAIAHSGGLIGMSPHDALTTIRRLSLPYWGKEEKPEQVHAALATQHQEPKPCKHDFRRDEDNGGACCQLCGEVKP